jgi:hypothetical protein
MKQIFTKKYWLIVRANWRITKFQYFYSWKNTLKLIFAFTVVLPTLFVFVVVPKWIIDKIDDLVQDNMPSFLMVDENPEWYNMSSYQRKEFMLKLKDWN